MMSIHRLALAASAAIIVGALAVGSASAMPIGALQPAADTAQVQPENVAWVCGPFRCFWRPGGVYWGPRPWRYGWYRPYRRWW